MSIADISAGFEDLSNKIYTLRRTDFKESDGKPVKFESRKAFESEAAREAVCKLAVSLQHQPGTLETIAAELARASIKLDHKVRNFAQDTNKSMIARSLKKAENPRAGEMQTQHGQTERIIVFNVEDQTYSLQFKQTLRPNYEFAYEIPLELNQGFELRMYLGDLSNCKITGNEQSGTKGNLLHAYGYNNGDEVPEFQPLYEQVIDDFTTS